MTENNTQCYTTMQHESFCMIAFWLHKASMQSVVLNDGQVDGFLPIYGHHRYQRIYNKELAQGALIGPEYL